jgi:hypothetical protein
VIYCDGHAKNIKRGTLAAEVAKARASQTSLFREF